MFVFGALINFARTLNIPRIGTAALGAVELILFLLLPFNVDVLSQTPVEFHIVLAVIVAILGAGAASAPGFMIALGGIAICASQIGVNIYLWIDAQGAPSNVDWTGALIIIGAQVGAGLAVGVRGLSRVRI